MKLRLITVAKGRTGWADDAARVYTRRLRRYGPFEEIAVRPTGAPSTESARVLKQLGSRDRLVALDERGEALGSEGWARVLDGARQDGATGLWFAIGGPDGHAPALRARADRVLRLAPMVLAHQVARVVALEQLYRAWTILKGEPYHRA